MSIVPIGELSLKAEVKILNKDVGFVRTGQTASVQLDAFNYIKYMSLCSALWFQHSKKHQK
jgi:RTX toxin transport system membrane fusion protein